MNENNELNDIILNKGGSANSNKKIILAVATLSLILIIVLMLMNSLSSNNNENLPQAIPALEATEVTNEPLFEDIEVEEESASDSDLNKITQKLKQESLEEDTPVVVEEEVVIIEEPVKVTPKPVVKKKAPKPVATKSTATSGSYYIQVGSFSIYEPNKKFLKSITNLGFSYKYHKVKALNKVLVGPFQTSKEAKNARRVLRAKVEPGSFLVKL